MQRVSERINHMTISEVFSLTGGNPFLLFTIKDILSPDILLSENENTPLREERSISFPKEGNSTIIGHLRLFQSIPNFL